jgi:putative hydrolase of HD superfamily
MDYGELAILFHKIGELKNLKRKGWIRHGISEPESVADHAFRVAFMAMILGDIMKLDSYKLLKMAIIHDLAEIKAGDITPFDSITISEKRRMEKEGLSELLRDVPNLKVYLDLWIEYEEQKSKEAIILKNIDKLEMAFQAKEYQMTLPEKDLSEFIFEAEEFIEIPEIRKLIFEIKGKNI